MAAARTTPGQVIAQIAAGAVVLGIGWNSLLAKPTPAATPADPEPQKADLSAIAGDKASSSAKRTQQANYSAVKATGGCEGR
jgi:hypothetical protein